MQKEFRVNRDLSLSIKQFMFNGKEQKVLHEQLSYV